MYKPFFTERVIRQRFLPGDDRVTGSWLIPTSSTIPLCSGNYGFGALCAFESRVCDL